MSPRSLVLIDEIGTDTATSDGLGIAWAVAENLISVGAGCLFATHFDRLNALEAMYPNCKLWHFDVDCQETLSFNWKLLPGPGLIQHYGLLLGPLVITQLHILLCHKNDPSHEPLLFMTINL